MEIRFCKPSDASRLVEIYEHYVVNTTITFEVEVPTVEDFKNRIEKTCKQYPYIVAIKDHKIIGYAYASRYRERKAFDYSVELSIYLDQAYCHGGVGKILYGTLLELLTKQGYAVAYGCLTYPNIASEALHKHFDFDEIGIFHKSGYKFDRWLDIYWVEKILNEETSKIVPIQQIRKEFEEQR